MLPVLKKSRRRRRKKTKEEYAMSTDEKKLEHGAENQQETPEETNADGKDDNATELQEFIFSW